MTLAKHPFSSQLFHTINDVISNESGRLTWATELKNKSDGEQPYGLVAFLLKVKATAFMEQSLHFIVLCRLHSHIIAELLFLSDKILRL